MSVVSAMPAYEKFHYVAAFGADDLSVGGPSWCFRCSNISNVYFGLAKRDSVPAFRPPGPTCTPAETTDVPAVNVIKIYGTVSAIYGAVSHMFIGNRGTPSRLSQEDINGNGPVLLRFEVRNETVYLRINVGPEVAIAEKIGPLSLWTPYVSFYVQAISRGEKVALVDVD